MWSSTSCLLLRRLPTSGCSKQSKSLLRRPLLHLQRPRVKLIASRHDNGQLRIPSSRSIQIQENCRLAWGLVTTDQRKDLVPVVGREPRSLTRYGQEVKRCRTSPGNQGTAQTVNKNLVAERVKCKSNAEEPLLFSIESSPGYHGLLDSIAAATESGNLCSSAAARLRDLCHVLHMERVILAAARPCHKGSTSDDIIIRQGSASPLSDSFPPIFPADDRSNDAPLRADSSKRFTSLSSRDCNGHTHHASHKVLMTSAMPSPLENSGRDSAVDLESNKLSCDGARKTQHGKTSPSDGPSKDQLAYMHHRLSQEMPRFFEQHHDYSLYSGNILFDNRIMNVSTRGVTAYKATVQSLKYLMTAYLVRTEMEVLRITMEMEQGCVQARWRIKGIPLHSYMLRPWAKNRKLKYFDAFSTFYVGTDGLIHKHVVDKVMPSSEKAPVSSWAVKLGIMLGLVRPPAFDPDVTTAIGMMKNFFSK